MRAGQRCGPRGDLLAAVWLLSRSGLAALCFAAVAVGAALAQTGAPAGILAPGNAAVTGFSEAHPPASVPPGTDPDDKTFIDLKGPSLRVIDLQNMGGPPQAQLVRAPKPYTATAAQIGQVFAVALDDASPPNIYVAATSAYGLPIMVGPDRRRAGRDLHARIVRPAARRPGIDLEDRPADRRRLAVRQCNLQRRRQSRPGARRACLRSGIEEPVRRRPRHRHDPSLRARWDRARRLRPRRSGSSGGRIAGGRLRSGEAPRHHQPAVQHRGLEDLGLCAGRAARVRPRGAGRPALLRGQGSIADLVGVDCGRRVRRGCAHRDQCPAGRRRHRDVENPVRRSGTHGARRASGAVRRLRLRGAHPGGNCATATAASRSATTTRRTD